MDIISFNYPLSIIHFSFLDGRFVNEHNGNVVADRINKRAFGILTFQACRSFVDLYGRLALRAAENF